MSVLMAKIRAEGVPAKVVEEVLEKASTPPYVRAARVSEHLALVAEPIAEEDGFVIDLMVLSDEPVETVKDALAEAHRIVADELTDELTAIEIRVTTEGLPDQEVA